MVAWGAGVSVGADAFGEGRPHVHADRLDLAGAVGAELVEEGVQGGGVLARLAPHDLPGGVVGDQGQILVVLAPADLVHPDVDQAVEALGVEFVAHDPFADAAHGVPVDAQEPRDGRLVGLRGQERGDVFEVAGEPAAMAGERDCLNDDPMLGAGQPAQPSPDLDPGPAEVQVPPARPDRAGVVAGPSSVRAQRTGQPPGPQPHLDHHPPGIQRRAAHVDTGQVEQVVQ